MKKSIVTLIMVVSVLLSLILSKMMAGNDQMIQARGNRYMEQVQLNSRQFPMETILSLGAANPETGLFERKTRVNGGERSSGDSGSVMVSNRQFITDLR